MGWRIVFLIGALVALIGSIARTTLRETPDFADAKRRISNAISQANEDPACLKKNIIMKEKINPKTALSLFLIQCTWPACCYFFYIHCGSILKNSFGFTAEQIISQNFIVSIAQLVGDSFIAYLCYKIYPLNILKTKLIVFTAFILCCPYLLNNISSSYAMLLIQMFAVVFVPTVYPATPIFYIHFPIFKRFTWPCLVHSLSRALMYVITSFGIIYLVKYFDNYGILIIMLPILLGYIFGLFHFVKLEKVAGNYPEKKTRVPLCEVYR
jgi:hypothetical protein